MADSGFKIPPLSPLIGSSLRNFNAALEWGQVREGYHKRVVLSKALAGVLSPLRWYDQIRESSSKTPIRSPIFVVGHWRSGTTFLHNLLCNDPRAAYFTTYQNVFTNYLHSKAVLKPILNLAMPETRPSDNVRLKAEYPQEDEFALSNMTHLAFYHFFYFPEHVEEIYKRTVQLDDHDDRRSFFDVYDRLLRMSIRNTKGDRLVVKNPVNTARVRHLKTHYPDAKFIHIHRNPYIVFLSARKFFRELMPTLWLQRVSVEEIDSMVLDLYTWLYRDYLDQAAALPPDQLAEVSFEELESDPIEQTKSIYERLGIDGFENALPHFRKYLDSVRTYRKNRYQMTREEVDTVENRWGEYLRLWRYEKPETVDIKD